MTTIVIVGVIANVKVDLLQRERFDFDDGAILEMMIWRVPEPVEGCRHPYKYRLSCGKPCMTMVTQIQIYGRSWERISYG